MTPEDWQRVKPILDSALQLDSTQRPAFLNQACADASLRREIESLIAAHDQAGTGALNSTTLLHATLDKGTRLGDFQILSLLGAGGMGEVYRARDLRLDRDVAIKVLPRFVSLDAERLRRFEQEAKAAAALNHPNILAVFHMGSYEDAPYLVSELLEGESLREQVKRGPTPPKKAVDYAVQIAHGLAAAHEKGIVHRDLKPENLFVTRNGRIKILDFGLAKLLHADGETQLTKQTLDTQPGAVLGTVGYMAPEQVRGLAADHRADIFAFGAILYELLTGKRAFHKSTFADTMSAILNEDPPSVSQTMANIPPALERAVRRCLEKSPDQRFQSASDLAFALELSSDSGSSSKNVAASTKSGGTWKWLTAAGIALILVLGAFLWRNSKASAKLTEKDTVVLSDFANSTGDPIFDDTLKQALTAALRQSPFLNVLSDNKVSATLQLMTRPVNTPLTPEVAREVCLRSNSKASIGGSIASLGSEYVIGLKALNCQNGDTLAQEQVTAANKEKVLDVLGQATTKLRGELGESLANVQKFDTPLTQATTPSLEALKTYSLGRKTLSEKGAAAALPFFQHAVELDPEFAVADATLGTMCMNLGEHGRARELFTKAYSLRKHASERERFYIESQYYELASGELESGTRAFHEWLNSYPRDHTALNNLALTYSSMGQYQQAIDLAHEELRQEPNILGSYLAYAGILTSLNQLSEARATLQDALKKKLDTTDLHLELYWLDFLEGSEQGMGEQAAWAARSSEAEAMQRMLPLQASAEAYSGRLKESLDLSRQAVDSRRSTAQKETAAREIMVTALRQSLFGNLQGAHQTAASALSQPELGVEGKAFGALAFASARDFVHAESLLNSLAKQYPQGTLVQSVVVPTVQAQVELSRGDASKSIELLHAAELYELSDVALGGCIYPAYVRGQGYLALKNGPAAEVEFEKILNHRGIVRTCETGSLARLGLARAYVMQGNTPKARAAYQDFLTLWKDADSDIPILKEARAEFAKLH